MKLLGRRILVTGAASGIGRATARLFAAEGASLAFLDRDEQGMASVARDCASGTVAMRCVDLADKRAIQPAVNALVGELGGLDGVVNAAGFVIGGGILDTTLENWELMLDVMLTAPMLVCQAAVPALKMAAGAVEGGATIVNVASGAGLRPLPNNVAYCSVKAGAVMLSRQLALDLGPANIRVNAVCPGPVDTPLFQGTVGDASFDLSAILKQTYALGRVADPIEIARAILYLSSYDSSFVTGTAHAVDGGRTYS